MQQGLHGETESVFEQWISDRLAENAGTMRPEVDYNIPVVFHVIYQNASNAWNISAAQIQSQVDILNEDFKRLNADTMNAPANFRAVAAGSNINFCLAQRDPQGNPSTGIVRWPFTQSASWSISSIDATIKPATIWDPTRYLNIWVVNISGGTLGYAQFPVSSGLAGMPGSGSANTDGIVLLYNSVGRPPDNPFTGVYNKGRTATHEVGHWLGLRHIWGDGSSCSATDYCADTPPSDAANYGCASTHASCSGPDMVQNYMDYSDDDCVNLFTYNQVQRMWTVLANSPRRVSLLTANSCRTVVVTPGPLTAAFTASDTVADFGGVLDTLQFTDQSVGVPTTRFWTISPPMGWVFAPGSTASSANPRLYFTTAGQYTVKLKVTNSFGSDSLTRTNYIRARATACASGATDLANTRVASFTFAGTTNTYPTGTGNCATYTDRTGSPPFQVTLGQTYSATLVRGTCGGNYAAYAKVFIDFNRNYQFESSEMVMSGALANTANATLTATNISVSSPVASAGLCLLRVVLHEGGSTTLTQACGTYQWGETQDYMVQINGGVTIQPVSGLVTYNNSANTPMSAVNVRLLTVPGGVQDALTTTISNGTYSMSSYTNGVRTFSLNTSRTTGGINATDALQANLHFANTQPLTGLRFRAADVNASNSVNASDALVINRRYSNVISTFPAGEWVFDTATIVTNGSAITRNLKAMCYGDVNGSFIPGAARQGFGEFELIEDRHDPSGVAGGGSLGYVDGIIGVTMLRSSGQARVGALSLDIAWPDFLGDPVVFSQLGDQEMVYARTGGRLRLAWNDVKGVDLSNNQPVVEIHHRCGILPESWSWNVAAGSEWADPLALPLQELGLRIPAPRKVANADEALFYPNPTDGQVQVVFGANLQALLNTVANQTGSLQWLVRDLSGRVYGMFPFVSGRSDHHMQSSSPGFQASSVLDLSPLRSGLYTLELYGSSGISLMKPHRLIRR
jgi:PKD repeat protein